MDDSFFSWLSKGGRTVVIDTATSGNNTLHTSTAGRRFCVTHLWLQAEAGVDVILKSGGTAITGTITFAANAEKEWKNGGAAVFVARTASDNLVLNLSGNVQVNGFAVLTEMHA